jgi:hypothetical protein
LRIKEGEQALLEEELKLRKRMLQTLKERLCFETKAIEEIERQLGL